MDKKHNTIGKKLLYKSKLFFMILCLFVVNIFTRNYDNLQEIVSHIKNLIS